MRVILRGITIVPLQKSLNSFTRIPRTLLTLRFTLILPLGQGQEWWCGGRKW